MLVAGLNPVRARRRYRRPGRAGPTRADALPHSNRARPGHGTAWRRVEPQAPRRGTARYGAVRGRHAARGTPPAAAPAACSARRPPICREVLAIKYVNMATARAPALMLFQAAALAALPRGGHALCALLPWTGQLLGVVKGLSSRHCAAAVPWGGGLGRGVGGSFRMRPFRLLPVLHRLPAGGAVPRAASEFILRLRAVQVREWTARP